jgi:SAM-dependent methyltransferase
VLELLRAAGVHHHTVNVIGGQAGRACIGDNRAIEELLAGQIRYYRARAGEYDEWWERRGRYDRGGEANAAWFAEAAELRAALDRFEPGGRVLELACGTGIWTERLAEHASELVALDAAPEAIEIARARVPRARFLTADVFGWRPEQRFGVCFLGFWLSHVPHERWQEFWHLVESALEPDGRVFFIDSAPSELASAADHALPEDGEQTALRRLADGREFTIIKHWFDPLALQERLSAAGWEMRVRATPTFFVYGEGRPPASAGG